MTLVKVTSATGLYKVKVETVTNPASRRGSGPFGRVVHRTAQGAEIAEYSVAEKRDSAGKIEEQNNVAVYERPPVTIQTEYAAQLGVKPDGKAVTQHSEAYSKLTIYEMRFTTGSVVRAVNDNDAKVTIVLNYPKAIPEPTKPAPPPIVTRDAT
jgi:hypothetical protein